MIGLIGRGYWGNTYAQTLDQLGLDFWQAGRNWPQKAKDPVDGVIIASSTESHYHLAKTLLRFGVPVLVEKPVATSAAQVQELVDLGGIAFAGHTRLYSPTWREFKRGMGEVQSVTAFAGGVNESNPDAELNWWTHLAAMCWDLGFDPANAVFNVTTEKQPLRFIANGQEFRDGPPGALACLITEFLEAAKSGKPNNEGLKLGLKTLQYVEARRVRMAA